ncbi:MAG: M13 family metallopeptidase [Gemmatimonadales bacterium]|jgi:predicted metalloendopeptidase|nr:M13 family metallopeptidase [Gemmatimonadales bacterium]
MFASLRALLATTAAALLVLPTAAVAQHGLDLAGRDTTVRPGDDFFRYANGTWLARTTIPADRSSYGAFHVADEVTEARRTALVEELVRAPAPPGSDARKVADYYTSWVDTAAIDARGLAPLQAELRRIAAIVDHAQLSRHLGGTLRADVDVFNATALHTENLFGLWVAQDLSEPSRYAPHLLQGGLGMPDREYYLDGATRMASLREGYRAHVTAMLRLANVPDAEAKGAAIMALETKLAAAHWSREATYDPTRGNNPWPRRAFATRAPGLDWDAYFTAAGLTRPDTIVVWQPSALAGLSALTRSEPLDAWKAWLTYHAIARNAAVLPGAFDREQFGFFGATMTGLTAPRARPKRALVATEQVLGFAVARHYTERHFPAADKARAERMVADIIAAFDRRIDRLDWMAPATKAEAKAKLRTLRVGVGYPDRWPDHATLDVRAGDAYGNAERASLARYRAAVARIGRPVDRSEWLMLPQEVNALNMPAMNAMNFPAAILQPPFFDASRTSAMDYGAIGAVIGHEVSHSFDNLGAQFDAQGRLRNWWTPDDLAHFTAASAALVRQFDAYRPFPDLAVNGSLTLSENIADVAGLSAAYDAWQASLDGEPAPVVDGLTGDQQFFLSFAQAWRITMREPALRQRIVTDAHAPGAYRAATVRNLDPWYRAYDVRAGEALHLPPAERVRVW